MQLPRLIVVLEGEARERATALILYRFAVAAVAFGVFSALPLQRRSPRSSSRFSGIVVGWLMLRLRRARRRPADRDHAFAARSLYRVLAAGWLGGSGVLATVVTGLYISWNGLRLISAATRLQGIFFWDLLIYLLEGLMFLVTGLQAHPRAGLGSYSARNLALSALLVCAVIIVARFVWVFPATCVPRRLSASLASRSVAPWQSVFLLGFTGIRGIVSLAAALAIPLPSPTAARSPNAT
jgi:CPA1 family monovalent cation:H+ antiporter